MVHDIAIVGMGCRFPGAPDLATFNQVIQRGEPQIGTISRKRWRHENFFAPGDFRARNRTYTDRAACVENIYQFAAMHYGIAPSRARVMDPQHRLLLDAVRAALQDAGLERRSFDRARTGVFIGVSASEYAILLGAALRARQMVAGEYGLGPGDEATAEAMMAATENVPPVRAFSLPGTLVNMAAATVSDCFNLGGPSFTMDAACSASLVALTEAILHIRAGLCSAAVVGGVYLSLIPDAMICFSKVGALSFTGHCRPFDKRADGFVFGEGVGAVVVRPLEEALAAGDRIYAVVRGVGISNDGTSEGPMTPMLSGQLAALRQAYRDADLDPLSVGFIEAHGTATTVGDKVETAALAALREGAAAAGSRGYLSSVKSIIGHSLTAAGVAGLIKAALCVYHGVIPPQPDIQPNPKLPLEAAGLRLTSELLAWPGDAATPRRAGVNSFGFGGTNVHVVLEQAPAVPNTSATTENATLPELFLFSAGSRELLARYLGEILTRLEQDPALSLSDLAYTLATRQLLTARVAIVAAGRDELVQRLQAGRTALTRTATDTPTPDGVFFLAEPLSKAKRDVAFLFSGQGSQQPGMLADLIERFPRVRASLEDFDAVARRTSGVSVIEAAHGPEADTREGRARLRGTEVCQPVLGAHWMALTRFLADLSVEPHLALGHSVGEFPAAASLGLLDAPSATAFMAERGRAMASIALDDTGGMLAMRCDRSTAATLTDGVEGAWIANHNQPKQVVVSGTVFGLVEVEKRAAAARIQAKRLDVSHAFHSPLFEGIGAQMAESVGRCALSGPTERLISCISGRGGQSAAQLAEIWARHQISPVEFVAGAESADAAGARVYVQVGGGSSLLSLVRASLGDHTDGRWFVALSGTGPDDGRSFLTGIGQLAVLGVPVNPLALFDGLKRRLLDLPVTLLATQRWGPKERKRVAPATSAGPAAPEAGDVSEPVVEAEWESTSNMDKTNIDQSKIDQLIALFREQNAVLLAASGGSAIEQPLLTALLQSQGARAAGGQAERQTVVVAASVPAPAAAPLPLTAGNGAQANADVSAKVTELVARVSGFPAGDLESEQKFVADLGFDSLMIADLLSSLQQVFPQFSGELSEFSDTTTLGELMEYFQVRFGAPVAAPAVVTTTTVVLAAPTTAAPAAAVVAPHPIPSEAYRIEEFPEVRAIADRIRNAEEMGLINPYFMVNDGISQGTTVLDGQEVINFSSYNYLGLSGHPTVVKAVQDAVARYGSSVSASRMLSGEKPIHQELESELAALLGTPDALVLVSGHATNVTLIGHLVGPGDLIIHDSLAHNSIMEGCKLSGATRRPFPHNDHATLDALLGKMRHQYRRVLVLIEGVYSMDGDIPDLPAFIAVKKKHRALLMIDEAHSIGVLGTHGAGIGEHFGVDRGDVDLWAGTMSKSLASCGGYVGGSRELIKFLRYTTPGFIYSAGITPANTAAALAALRQMRAEPELIARLRERSRLLLNLAKDAGIDVGDSHDSPVVPCILRDSLKSIRLSNALLRRGINVYPIMYPAVPEELARLRFFVTACHSEEQIRYTVKTITEELAAL